MCTVFRTACVVGLMLIGSMLSPSPARAEQPPLVPRLLLSIGLANWDGPDWDEPYSVALIAVPNDKNDAALFQFAPNQDCALIQARLAANLGVELDEVADLASLVCEYLDGAVAQTQNPLHATMGQVEPEPSLVYWVGALPPPGARAKSGPGGDVRLLGTFGIKQVNAGDDPQCTQGGYCDDWRIVTSGAAEVIHLAIGWFTK